MTNPPPDSILNDMHDAGEDVSQPTSGNVVDVEFGLDDLHAVIRNTNDFVILDAPWVVYRFLVVVNYNKGASRITGFFA